MFARKLLWSALVVLCGAMLAWGQDQATSVKHTTIKPTSPSSGKEMYLNYCAVCHGKDGKGAGPAAEALKTPPTDLTLLSQKNGGKFPAAHVSTVIRGEGSVSAHGSKDMPVWGPLFRKLDQGDTGVYEMRVANITKFLETLQAK